MQDNSSVLLKPSSKGFTIVVQFLLDNGADPNIANEVGICANLLILNECSVNLNLFPCKQEGHTPLNEAAAKSHKDVVQVLLNNNADVTCRTLDVC